MAGENLEFLIFAYQALGEQRLLDPIRRGMDIFLETQQPMPQPGWGLQHYVHDLTPRPPAASSRAPSPPTPRRPISAP